MWGKQSLERAELFFAKDQVRVNLTSGGTLFRLGLLTIKGGKLDIFSFSGSQPGEQEGKVCGNLIP